MTLFFQYYRLVQVVLVETHRSWPINLPQLIRSLTILQRTPQLHHRLKVPSWQQAHVLSFLEFTKHYPVSLKQNLYSPQWLTCLRAVIFSVATIFSFAHQVATVLRQTGIGGVICVIVPSIHLLATLHLAIPICEVQTTKYHRMCFQVEALQRGPHLISTNQL